MISEVQILYSISLIWNLLIQMKVESIEDFLGNIDRYVNPDDFSSFLNINSFVEHLIRQEYGYLLEHRDLCSLNSISRDNLNLLLFQMRERGGEDSDFNYKNIDYSSRENMVKTFSDEIRKLYFQYEDEQFSQK